MFTILYYIDIYINVQNSYLMLMSIQTININIL